MVATTQPSKEEWEAIEKSLSHQLGSAKFIIDGYEVSAQVQKDKMKLVIMVYVGGKFKGKWVTNDCEERRRFFRQRSKFVHPKSRRDEMKKSKSKKLYNELGWDADEKLYSYVPWWNSARSLRLHLVKNNESIEWVTL